MIIAIVLTTLVGIPFGVTSMPEQLFSMPATLGERFLNIDFAGALNFAYIPFLIALFIPDFFNHIGQLLLDENDFFPQEKIEINKFLRGKENPPPDGCIHDGMESAGKGAANEDKR